MIPSAPLGTDAAAGRPQGLGAAPGAGPDQAAAERRFRFELAAHPGSPAQARRLARARLTGWSVCEDTCDTAALVISELVTNAIVHTASDVVVCELLDGDDVLRIAVRDQGCTAENPHPSPQRPEEEHGRGLLLVEALCHAWGAQEHGSGLLVWADLPRGADGPEAVDRPPVGADVSVEEHAEPRDDLGWGVPPKPGPADGPGDEDEAVEQIHRDRIQGDSPRTQGGRTQGERTQGGRINGEPPHGERTHGERIRPGGTQPGRPHPGRTDSEPTDSQRADSQRADSTPTDSLRTPSRGAAEAYAAELMRRAPSGMPKPLSGTSGRPPAKEHHVPEQRAAGPFGPELRIPEQRVSDLCVLEHQGPSHHALDQAVFGHAAMQHTAVGHSHGHSPLNHSPLNHRAPEHRAPEHRAPEHRTPEHRATDHRATDHRATDHRATDHRALDHCAPAHRAPDHRTADAHRVDERGADPRTTPHPATGHSPAPVTPVGEVSVPRAFPGAGGGTGLARSERSRERGRA